MPSATSTRVAGSEVSQPRPGLMTIVRCRRGVISEVRDFDGEHGRFHVVRVDYKDDHRPASEELVWELEPSKRLLEPTELPRADAPVMREDDFDALIRAARWTAFNPYLDPDGHGPLTRFPACSPFHGAVEVEDYQLVPLLKALRMPRISMLIADDVGLGKTVEAGLILAELLIRRRVNRVLILTPASLRLQWRDEMWTKFSLPFDVIDRDSTLRLKRSLGIDANPWRCCSRIIASYHYLRQPDVLEQFVSASRTADGSPHLPWDLLLVDEVHNLMPSPFGEDSQLCDTLRRIAPSFEHRLFLTATPHNGHTRSFTGLLELLDPVRFTRTDELAPAQRERIKQVVIRRLKREINARTNPPRFCNRNEPRSLVLEFARPELALIEAFEALRTKIRSVIAAGSKKRRLAGRFAIEILGKRMLSGPMTFLESWRRCKLGLEESETAEDSDVVAAGRTAAEDTDDDREAQQREATAAAVIGAWLKPLARDIESQIASIDAAAEGLSVRLDRGIVEQDPATDARFDEACRLIERLVRQDGTWHPQERLIIFTEYKTTLDYLLRRLRARYAGQDERFLCLFGGMDDLQREQIKDAFNDPDSQVRVLIATDAASEGLNLQSTARYLLHYDCPWNPSRLEQRNGRLDRHGQARDVSTYHFVSEQDSDLKFLSYLIDKVHKIREDLGAVGELFDEATHRRLIEGEAVEIVQQSLDLQIEQARGTTDLNADDTIQQDPATGEAEFAEKIEALAAEVDLDGIAGHSTLEAAMAIEGGRPQLSAPDDLERFTLVKPNLMGWKDTIDEAIRKKTAVGGLGPVPKLTFSPKAFLFPVGARHVFRPRIDTMMLHLGHPLIQRATGTLARRRFPGPNAVSRWVVRYGEVPTGADALILLHVEELAVNALRETFHHWVRTIQLPVKGGELGDPLPHQPARQLRSAAPCRDDAVIQRARDLLDEVEPDLQKLMRNARADLTRRLTRQLEVDKDAAVKEEEKKFDSRQGEVSTLIENSTLGRLEREIEALKRLRTQGRLFDPQAFLDELDRSMERKQEEVERRRRHYEEVREQLSRERERILRRLLPSRFTLQGEAQIFPIGVEVRLRAPAGGAQ